MWNCLFGHPGKPRLLRNHHHGRCQIGLHLALGLSLISSGCGQGLFGPKIHTTATQAGKITTAPESPLPPVQLDPKLVKAGTNVLYGRVVINGKPAKKGSLLVCAAAQEDIENDQLGVAMMKRKGNGKGQGAVNKRHSVQIVNDDGLYVIQGVNAAQYKVFCRFGTAFAGKESVTIQYSVPKLSPFRVDIVDGENMQDIVMEIEGAESLGVIKK